MIIVGRQPLNTAKIIGEYPANSIERQLLDQMSKSGSRYRYDSLNTLKFDLRLRKEIVRAAMDLHHSGMSFADFHDTRVNPAYWERTDNGGFKLKPGVSPAAAINDIAKNGEAYATECATAMVIVYYLALLRIYGERKFNQTFPEIYLMNWDIEDPLLSEASTPRAVPELLLGDRGYIVNPDVNPKSPQWQGENVIVLPEGLLYGHGIGVGTTKEMIDALNANRKPDAEKSAYMLGAAGRLDAAPLADIYYRPQRNYF